MGFYDWQEIAREAGTVEGWFAEHELVLLCEGVAEAARRRRGRFIVLEIGSYKGRSTTALGLAVRRLGSLGTIRAVDPHQGERSGRHDRLYHEPPTYDAFASTIRRFGLEDLVEVVRCNSTDAVLEHAVSFALIDALHLIEQVKADFECVRGVMVPDGLIAFHDYSGEFPGVRSVVDALLMSRNWVQWRAAGTLIVLERSSDDHALA